MNPNDNTEISAATLVALRQEADALRTITEHLKVKAMGPADHIRTKHEVKAFIESAGDLTAAEAITVRALSRLKSQEIQNATLKVAEQQSRGMRQ